MPIVSGAKHSHTTFEVLDAPASLRFYREVLGLSTLQHIDKGGLWCATNHHVTACLQLPKLTPQPYWNYHARPVTPGSVDRLFAEISAVQTEYGIRELRPPTKETRFGIGSYGFALADRDGNWWRIEENDGPFGPMELPDVRSTSIVPAGPIAYVTLEAEDLDATTAFYTEVLDLPVERIDGAIHSRARNGGVNLVTVPVQGELLPQPVLNHHGITLPENAQARVTAIHEAITAEAERYGVRKIQRTTDQHGSFQFYFQDRDTNWWEIETLSGGLDPWQRANLPDGDERLLNPNRGHSQLRQPFPTPTPV
jgi:catechol 2,3-dioxygenase-like lactoylglutathione lyase family enzyme